MEGKWGQERSCGGITRLAWQTFDPYSVYRGVYHRPHPSPKPPLLSSAMCASSHAPRRFLYPTGEEVLFNRRPSFENEWIFVQISEMESTWHRDRCVQVVLEFQSVVNTRGKFGGRAIEAVGKFLSLVEINRWFNHSQGRNCIVRERIQKNWRRENSRLRMFREPKADSLRIKNNPLPGKLAGWRGKRRRKKRRREKSQSAGYQCETILAVGVIIIALAGLGARHRMCNLR